MQEVYASEQNAIGSWVAIGYKDPAGGTGAVSGATTNFNYIQGTAGTDDWKALSSVGLNDCQIGTEWGIGSTYTSGTGNIDFQPLFKAVGTGCTVDGLTPNFCKLGSKTACASGT